MNEKIVRANEDNKRSKEENTVMGVPENKRKKDAFGRYCECYFLKKRKKKSECSALTAFYNADEEEEQCLGCPFFKTKEEFTEGWHLHERRRKKALQAG